MRFWHSCIFLSLLTLGNLGAQTIELSELSSGKPQLIGDQADYIMNADIQKMQGHSRSSIAGDRSVFGLEPELQFIVFLDSHLQAEGRICQIY